MAPLLGQFQEGLVSLLTQVRGDFQVAVIEGVEQCFLQGNADADAARLVAELERAHLLLQVGDQGGNQGPVVVQDKMGFDAGGAIEELLESTG